MCMYNRERGGKVFLYVCIIEREVSPNYVDIDVLQLSSG